MGRVQFIYGDDGERLFAVVPADRFENMTEAEEELADIAAFDAAKARIAAGERLIPGEIVRRIDVEGENPVRVWRQHRGLKANELARRAGVSHGYLSEIENGKKDGSFKTISAIAKALDIDIDDLVPSAD